MSLSVYDFYPGEVAGGYQPWNGNPKHPELDASVDALVQRLDGVFDLEGARTSALHMVIEPNKSASSDFLAGQQQIFELAKEIPVDYEARSGFVVYGREEGTATRNLMVIKAVQGTLPPVQENARILEVKSTTYIVESRMTDCVAPEKDLTEVDPQLKDYNFSEKVLAWTATEAWKLKNPTLLRSQISFGQNSENVSKIESEVYDQSVPTLYRTISYDGRNPDQLGNASKTIELIQEVLDQSGIALEYL